MTSLKKKAQQPRQRFRAMCSTAKQNRTDLPMIDCIKQDTRAARVDYAHFGA